MDFGIDSILNLRAPAAPPGAGHRLSGIPIAQRGGCDAVHTYPVPPLSVVPRAARVPRLSPMWLRAGISRFRRWEPTSNLGGWIGYLT